MLGSDSAEKRGERLTASDAHGHDAKFEVAAHHIFSHAKRQNCTCGTNWMAQGDCTAVRVDPLGSQTGIADDRQRLGGECLVEFDNVDVSWGGSGLGEQVGQRKHGGVAH